MADFTLCAKHKISNNLTHFQTSQVGLELAEKSARVTELEDFLSLRDKEMKQLQDKLREVVCIISASLSSLILT